MQLTHGTDKTHAICQLVGPETAVPWFGWTCAIKFETHESVSFSEIRFRK